MPYVINMVVFAVRKNNNKDSTVLNLELKCMCNEYLILTVEFGIQLILKNVFLNVYNTTYFFYGKNLQKYLYILT